MKILLIGGSGMIGSHIQHEAVKKKHSVVSASRNPDKTNLCDGITAVKTDVNDTDAIADLAKNADAIVSAVSPRTTGDPVTEAAAIGKSLIAAAEKSGKRLFVVGGAGSLKLPDGRQVLDTLPDFLIPEATGMRNVYLALQNSSIDWTFFCPPASITPGEPKGGYRLGGDTLLSDAEGNSAISAGDYGHAVIAELEDPKHSRAIFTIAY